jgi:DNA repair exonuclease SbcCD ATPase subunit
MSQIDELQRRINAAMDRIGQGLDSLSAAPSPENAGEAETLKQDLEEERLANEQLKERITALKQKVDGFQGNLNTQLDAQRATATRLDSELNRLRKANDQLRASNAALREANQEGVGEPHLINKAMLAELEALRSVRAAEVEETQAIMKILSPLIDQAAGQQEENA